MAPVDAGIVTLATWVKVALRSVVPSRTAGTQTLSKRFLEVPVSRCYYWVL